jgi:hypothetical protein
MSKSKLPEQTNPEEVDLGHLFKIIGKGFYNFFNFIGKIFLSAYKVFLLLLIHFFKRKYWYAGVIILGVLIGFLVDETSEKEYGANMFIETNFNSARQVYENIRQLHQLAHEDKDSLELARILNIAPDEASKIKGFYIDPDLDENEMIEMYSNFFTRLDSISRLDMTYNKYKKSLTSSNFSIHMIGVASTDKFIFKKFEKGFLKEISGNTYLNELIEVNKLNLDQADMILSKEIKKTDSLLNEYLKIRINESQKEPIPGSGTNLYMGNAESNNLIVNESSIIDKILNLESQRREINTERVTQKTAVNVLANFPESGYDISEWYDKIKILLPLVLFSLTFLIFTLIGLGKYLDEESKKEQ